MTKSFLMFLVLIVALGVSIGGAFAGGVAFGRSQDNETGPGAANVSGAGGFGGNFGQQAPGGASQGAGDGGGFTENLAELRQRIQSGDVSPEDLAQLRQRFQSGDVNPEDLARLRQGFQDGGANSEGTAQLGQPVGEGNVSPEDLTQLRQRFAGGFAGGFAGRLAGGVTGTVDTVDGDLVTVDTTDGPKTVTIGEETVIQKTTTGTVEDLQQGVRIAAFGTPEGEEGGEARFVMLIPEGATSPFGDGLFFGGGGRQGQDGSPEGLGERRFRRDGGSP